MITNLQDAIIKRLTVEHNNLVFSALSSYGIDRDNFHEQVNRVYAIKQDRYEHYFIDGVYGFSAHDISIEWNEETYRMNAGYDIELIPSMIGMRLEEYNP